MTAARIDWQRAQVAAEQAAATAAGPRVEHVDVTPWFCADGRCPAVLGGRLVRIDRSHLTEATSLATRDLLADRLLDRYPTIDVVANNAGGLVSDHELTSDGHERILQSNHLAPFLLTRLLLPRLQESGGRVVSTASVANMFGHVRLDDLNWTKRAWLGGWRQYGTSKIETILFVRELARRTGLEAFSFHPGIVKTSFGSSSPMWRMANVLSNGNYGISAHAGAVPLIQLSGPSSVSVENGTYFDQLKPHGRLHRHAQDDLLAEAL